LERKGHAEEDELEKMVLLTADGKVDKATIARFFKKNAQIIR
jgi:hypothetical protein